jgi:hypothetical protein
MGYPRKESPGLRSSSPRHLFPAPGVASRPLAQIHIPLQRISMRIPPRLLSLLALAVLAVAPPAAAQDEYPQLLARFQAGDSTVDVTALRMAYTRTDAYDPYGSDSDAVDAMWGHLNRERFAKAAEAAEGLLRDNWLDIAPHYVAAVAYTALENDSAAAVHAFAVRQLIASVGGPEDGRSRDAPMRVISTSEEYAYLNLYLLRRGTQSLGSCGAVRCDILEVTDEDGKRFELYFDISIPFGWLERSMSVGENEEKTSPEESN